MPGTALLFPGQGSQTDEMRDTVARVRPDLLVGADRFVEVGPGRVLSGLVKRTLRGVELAGV